MDWWERSGTASVSELVELACLMEATAAKPGNVHPAARFHDVTFADFVTSANAIERVFRNKSERVGTVIKNAVRATNAAVGSNTNLGMVLLLAPLASVPRSVRCRDGIHGVLERLNHHDCQDAYAAIRQANPGGLGTNDQADVRAAAPTCLVSAMEMASDSDLIARQYANGFADVLDFVVPTLVSSCTAQSMKEAIVLTHLTTMAQFPDSLIRRKCGPEIAHESSERASRVIDIRKNRPTDYRDALNEFDCWLRSDGNRRNPGTTADLIAAALFVLLRDERTAFEAVPKW